MTVCTVYLSVAGAPHKMVLAFLELMCDLIYSNRSCKFLVVICPVLQFKTGDGKYYNNIVTNNSLNN